MSPLPLSTFVSGSRADSSYEDRCIVRGMHLKFMGQPAASNTLPTEELRQQIDGPDTLPERRSFARAAELFERELRLPPPSVSWGTLRQGAAVPSVFMRGMPTLQERLDRRIYNEYCEPNEDFQPWWDRETVLIERRVERKESWQRRETAAKCLLGVTVGTGGLALYVASLVFGPVSYPVMGYYAVACLLSLVLLLRCRAKCISL